VPRIEQSDAWRRVRNIIEDCDLVLEVIDARDPLATRNSRVEGLVNRLGKKLIIVINKSDLVPTEVLKAWKNYLSKEYPVVFISAKYRLGTRRLMRMIKDQAPALPVKVAVVGYPNVGKSMIINYLKGRYVAQTSPVPGWTKGEQLVRAKSWLIVMDTPGVVPPEDLNDEALLIIKGAINPSDVEDPVASAIKLVERIRSFNPRAFLDRYGVDSEDPEAIIMGVGKRRGFLMRGGLINMDAAAIAIMRDWIEGKLTYHYYPPGDPR